MLRTDVIRIWNMRVSIPDNLRFGVNYTVFHTPKHYKIIIRVQEWQIDKNNSEKKGKERGMCLAELVQVPTNESFSQNSSATGNWINIPERTRMSPRCLHIHLPTGRDAKCKCGEQRKGAYWRHTIQRQEQYFTLYAPVWNLWCRKRAHETEWEFCFYFNNTLISYR